MGPLIGAAARLAAREAAKKAAKREALMQDVAGYGTAATLGGVSLGAAVERVAENSREELKQPEKEKAARLWNCAAF